MSAEQHGKDEDEVCVIKTEAGEFDVISTWDTTEISSVQKDMLTFAPEVPTVKFEDRITTENWLVGEDGHLHLDAVSEGKDEYLPKHNMAAYNICAVPTNKPDSNLAPSQLTDCVHHNSCFVEKVGTTRSRKAKKPTKLHMLPVQSSQCQRNCLNRSSTAKKQSLQPMADAAKNDIADDKRPYQCYECECRFTSCSSLRKHLQVVHMDERPYECSDCRRRFATNTELKRHVSARHAGATAALPFHCPDCASMFVNASCLAQHCLLHKNDADRPHRCTECQRGFASAVNLKAHMRLHDGAEGAFICPLCSLRFANGSRLKRHMLVHSGERPHQCAECDKAYATSTQLKEHARKHTGARPYRCHECTRAFAARNHLKRHMLTHDAGPRPHRCSECGWGFTTRRALKRHTFVHTGERPYRCDRCSKAFTSSTLLKRHALAHTGERPYRCDRCAWSFTQASDLKRHARKHSSNDGNDRCS